MERKAGVVLPLFSIRTRRDWGIGQITDLPACAAWVRRAGQRLLQILPPHELSPGETSPYGALTAFGLDPIYVDVDAVEDLDAAAVEEALGDEGKRTLARLRTADRVDHEAVRALKTRALRLAFERFLVREWSRETPRARRLAEFARRERAWLDDLALYTTLRESHGGWGWTTWPEDERDRTARGLDAVRADHGKRLLEVEYVQWTAHEQWERARARMRELGVELMGDLPFVVCGESADVWSHASQFQLHMSLGAPPDAYSADGQDWGLPSYDWLAMEADDLAWIRARTQHAARLYDRFRLDHVVGYFRQWVKRRDAGARGHFDPEGMDAQCARGRRVLGAILQELAQANHVEPPRALAEDLGVIPPFVRDVLRELGMPGYRVLPWEKDDGRFRDPHAFPVDSIVSWSTHDTAPIVAWWDELPHEDRAQLAARAGITDGMDDAARSLRLLGDLYGASSNLALVLAQELMGTRDRINTPATVGQQNWSWRLPRPIEDLEADPVLSARFEAIGRLVDASGR
ncbi:MAG TPA: 4-alpha-glucanotransferase [Polyangiaceae bacterium]|jgi:4-alpha-glucanotransferase